MANPDILTYIREQTSAGASKDVIKSSLLSNGWSEHDINEAFAPSEVNAPMNVVPFKPELKATHKSFIWIATGVAVLILSLAGAGAYFFLNKVPPTATPTSTATSTPIGSKDSPSVNDDDMRVAFDTTEVDCSVINNLTPLTVADRALVSAYGTSTSATKASPAIQKVIGAHTTQIDFFLNQGTWSEHAGVVKSDDTFACRLGNLPILSLLSLAKAKMIAFGGDPTAAVTILTDVFLNAQKFEDNPQSLILYLVGLAMKSSAVDLLTQLKAKGLVQEAVYKPLLQKYSDNTTGQKRAIQFEYSTMARAIDDLAASNDSLLIVDAFSEDFVASFRRDKNDYNFEPNNTKMLFYNYYKELYTNINKPCGSTYNTPPFIFDPNDTGENYLGKGLFSRFASGLTSLNNVNGKRCALESKFSQF